MLLFCIYASTRAIKEERLRDRTSCTTQCKKGQLYSKKEGDSLHVYNLYGYISLS